MKNSPKLSNPVFHSSHGPNTLPLPLTAAERISGAGAMALPHQEGGVSWLQAGWGPAVGRGKCAEGRQGCWWHGRC